MPFESPKTKPRPRSPGLAERAALMASLALTPTAGQDTLHGSPHPRAAAASMEEAPRSTRATRHLSMPAHHEQPSAENPVAATSNAHVGEDAVRSFLSDGDITAFFAGQSGFASADDLADDALANALSYRGTHLPHAATLAARIEARRAANAAILQSVEERVQSILSGAHGGNLRQRQELAVSLSSAFSMMFDRAHRALPTYELDGNTFIEIEPSPGLRPQSTEPLDRSPEDVLDPALADPDDERNEDEDEDNEPG